MSTSLYLEVVTPDKQVLSSEIAYVACPGVEGEFGVLKDHASLLSALKIGVLRYNIGDKDEYIFIAGGFADVNDNKVTVLAESAELAVDIDAARAKAAMDRAEHRLNEIEKGDVDILRAEAALQRSVVRLSLAGVG